MKTHYNKLAIRYFFLVLLCCIGCSEENNLQPEGEWELIEPIIELPSSYKSFILDETAPNGTITFSWATAVSTAGYDIQYEVVIDTLGSTSFDSPILQIPSENSGRGSSAIISYEQLDTALSYAGYPANELANLTWAVKATSLSRSIYVSDNISVQRFETELMPTRLFLSGDATEVGDNLENAILMKRLSSSDGSLSNTFEIYTSLDANGSFKFFAERSLPTLQFGGSDDNLVKNGSAIVPPSTGQYRVSVNLDDNTYSLLKIDFWSVVGSPIENGWGGDEPLEYQGAGIWKASIDLVATGGFLFRANGDWSFLLKRIVGTNNSLIMESQAADQGLVFEDIPSDLLGSYFVTLDLSADGYTYSFEEDNTVVEPIEPPTQLFLFADGQLVEELVLDQGEFKSSGYIPMQSSVNYSLNSQIDQSGQSYSVSSGVIGESSTPDGDRVSDESIIILSSETFSVSNDRGMAIALNFGTAAFEWTYYNFKLFHWQNWDDRVELPMTYQHPNTFVVTSTLNAGYDMKFISPWDFDLGSDAPNALTGSLINGGGSNLVNITNTGSYQVIMTLNSDYQSGTYEYIAQ